MDRFTLQRANNGLQLLWKTEGAYPFPYKGIQVQLHGAAVSKATIDGTDASFKKNQVRAQRPFAVLTLGILPPHASGAKQTGAA